jgi:hypothetical protein
MRAGASASSPHIVFIFGVYFIGLTNRTKDRGWHLMTDEETSDEKHVSASRANVGCGIGAVNSR